MTDERRQETALDLPRLLRILASYFAHARRVGFREGHLLAI
jgi:hypothetical protein